MEDVYWTFKRVDQLKLKLVEVWCADDLAEPKNHHCACYFWLDNLHGVNRKKTDSNVASARRPLPHSEGVHVPSSRYLSDLMDMVLISFAGDQVRASDREDEFEATSSKNRT